MTTNGSVSFWWEAIGRPAPRPALPGALRADVCIVGGGYTGLWTAYYLKKAGPHSRVVLLEREFCGFGASGRNGGWLYNGIAGRTAGAMASHGREAARRLADGHERHRRRGHRGSPRPRASTPTSTRAASSPSPATRPSWRGCGPAARTSRRRATTDVRLFVRRRDGRADRGRGRDRRRRGIRTRRAIQPAKLARGLARVVERSG